MKVATLLLEMFMNLQTWWKIQHEPFDLKLTATGVLYLQDTLQKQLHIFVNIHFPWIIGLSLGM